MSIDGDGDVRMADADNAAPRDLSPDRRRDDRERSRSPVSRSRRDDDRGRVADNPGNNLFVTGLSHRTRERDLEKLFGEYGQVQTQPTGTSLEDL